MPTYRGTPGNDYLFGSNSSDRIYSYDGDDFVWAYDGRDTIYGGKDKDVFYGGRGDDTLYGYAGQDSLYGDAGNDWLDGGSDNDTMVGGIGDDIYHVRDAGDRVIEYANQGTDTAWVYIDQADQGVRGWGYTHYPITWRNCEFLALLQAVTTQLVVIIQITTST